MNKRLLAAFTALAFVAACSNYPGPVEQSPSETSSLGPVQHKRVCDQPMAWQYKAPADDVPDKYKRLVGLWTGEVDFISGGSMCIAVAVSEVNASGDINAIFSWNLGGPSSANEFLNTHSQGTANWWAKGIKVDPKAEEMVVFSSRDPYNGLMYQYRFPFPDKGKMVGALVSTQLNGSTNSSDTAILTRSPYPAPLVADVGK
jgi:hypothetical protein